MKKIQALLLLSSLYFNPCFAQSDTAKKEKIFNHYVGVQINNLVKQVFNFGNSTTNTNTNPYLFTYSLNLKKNGWGVRIGAGYNYTATTTDDGISATKTDINDIHGRLGIEKAFRITDKWSAGAGADFVYNSENNHSVNKVNTGGPIKSVSTTDIKTKVFTYGGGPQAWLRYHLSKQILIGTEASIYAVKGEETREIIINNIPGSTTPNKKNPVTRVNFSTPIALFLVVKF